MQIKVLDHIIIGANRYYSYADERLIEKYEDSFFNLRIRGFSKKSANLQFRFPLYLAGK